MRFFKIITTILIFFISEPSYSHPHVWIDTDITFIIENGVLKGIKNNWKFDEDTYFVFSDGWFLGYWSFGLITHTDFFYEIELDGPPRFFTWLDCLLGNTVYIKENNLIIEKVTSYEPVIYIKSASW